MIDTRVKVLLSFLTALTIALLNNLNTLFIFFVIILLFLIYYKVTLKYLVKRIIPVLPLLFSIFLFLPVLTPGEKIFTLGIISFSLEGFIKSFILGLRIISILSIFSLLTYTTEGKKLLDSFLLLGIPVIFIQLMEFVLRYTEIIYEEARRMITARRSRSFSRNFSIKEAGMLLGMLFLRSLNRSERIYNSMLARGYNPYRETGENKPPFKALDLIVIIFSSLVLGLLIFIDKKGGLFF